MATTSTMRVLIIEHARAEADAAMAMAQSLGHETRIASTLDTALVEAVAWRPDAILLGIEPDTGLGTEPVQHLIQCGVGAPVIAFTASGSIGFVVRVMQAGAADVVVKPFGSARLATALAAACPRPLPIAERRGAEALPMPITPGRLYDMIGTCSEMQAVFRTIEVAAASRASVFITGESGTGKELAAEALHKAGLGTNSPFIALNCGAIPRDLLESEVFGHVKGAFTGATDNRSGAARAAHGGTLFLDEIGELPLDMQVKLLRFIQTKTFTPLGSPRSERVNVRFICATNRDPIEEMRAGRFREDLYYRLHVIPLEMPPLRARGDDVLLIAAHMLARFSAEEGRRFRGFDSESKRMLRDYHWPGNVRQLANLVRTAVVLQDGDTIVAATLRHLLRPIGAAPVRGPAPASVQDVPDVAAPSVDRARQPDDLDAALGTADGSGPNPPWPPDDGIAPLWSVEKRLILRTLAHVGNDVTRAASLLEVNPSTLYRKLNAWRAMGVDV